MPERVPVVGRSCGDVAGGGGGAGGSLSNGIVGIPGRDSRPVLSGEVVSIVSSAVEFPQKHCLIRVA